jgi:hypothetical protein
MSVITPNIFEAVIQKINTVKSDFASNQARILTEDDLKCLIFNKLYELFDHSQETMNPTIKGSPLHSELKFFDENRKLLIRPDITILEPKNLSILHSICDTIITNNGLRYKAPSSKGFEFGYDCIVIELKYYRGKSGIGKRELRTINNDLLKIRRLKNIADSFDNESRIYGIMVVFNKTDKYLDEFEELLYSNQIDDIKLIYGTGRVALR